MADPDHEASELDDDDDEHHRVPADTYARIPAAALPAMAPDGGFAAQAPGAPAPLPPATPATFVCLRGPCRHFQQTTTHLVSGNPKETWGEDGLRETMPCPACRGAGKFEAQPLLGGGVVPACDYTPNVGSNKGLACRLEQHHDGAHFYGHGIPSPVVVTCDPCRGTGRVADPEGAPVREPRQVSRLCLVHPGVETDYTEDNVYSCNHWDPLLPKEIARLEKRRRIYLKLHPDHAPKETPP